MSAESIKVMMPESERNYFTCLCLIIRSLGNPENFNNFALLLKPISTSPIFLGITETWLRNGQQGPHLCLPCYNFYSINRSKTEGRGVGAYVLQNKTHWIRNNLFMFEEDIFESIFIELKVGNVNIICGALYRPPNKSNNAIDAFISILKQTLNRVKNKLSFYILWVTSILISWTLIVILLHLLTSSIYLDWATFH